MNAVNRMSLSIIRFVAAYSCGKAIPAAVLLLVGTLGLLIANPMCAHAQYTNDQFSIISTSRIVNEGDVSISQEGREESLADVYVDGTLAPFSPYTATTNSIYVGTFEAGANALSDDATATGNVDNAEIDFAVTIQGPTPEDLPDSYEATVSLRVHVEAEASGSAPVWWSVGEGTCGVDVFDGDDDWSETASAEAYGSTSGIITADVDNASDNAKDMY